MPLVDLSTARAHKNAKGHDAVGASILLAINAESVELLLVDTSTQVTTDLTTLGIASNTRLS